jgi:hypothetical protein
MEVLLLGYQEKVAKARIAGSGYLNEFRDFPIPVRVVQNGF